MQVAVILKDDYNNKVIVLALRKKKKKIILLRKAIINCQVTKSFYQMILSFLSIFLGLYYLSQFLLQPVNCE